jgi:hypothetical protein
MFSFGFLFLAFELLIFGGDPPRVAQNGLESLMVGDALKKITRHPTGRSLSFLGVVGFHLRTCWSS